MVYIELVCVVLALVVLYSSDASGGSAICKYQSIVNVSLYLDTIETGIVNVYLRLPPEKSQQGVKFTSLMI